MRLVCMGTPEFAVPSLRALLDAGYPPVAVVTVPDRRWVWLMARQPAVPAAEYAEMVEVAREAGIETAKLRQVPQRW